jgi:hypothetical protein
MLGEEGVFFNDLKYDETTRNKTFVVERYYATLCCLIITSAVTLLSA